MTPDSTAQHPDPLILLAHGDAVFARSLETVLTHGGYRVLQADSGRQALDLARSQRPDGIILDAALAQPDDYGVCRALRSEPAVSLATPILLTQVGPVTRTQQLEALRAGAWELRGDPLDTEELLLRLGAYVQGKLEADRVGTEGLVDQASGLYNAAGVLRRSEELASLAARQGLALACVVFRAAETVSNGAAADELAVAFKAAGRISDAIGRTGPTEFAVFAPATDAPAAKRLVQRLGETVARAIHQPSTALRAGYSAAPATPRVAPADLLARARAALGGAPPPG